MNTVTTLRALILDFGGVLILPHNSEQRQRWLDRIGRENDEFEAWLWHTPEALAGLRGELTADEFWIGIGTQVGLSEEASLIMASEYWAGDQLNQPLRGSRRAWAVAGADGTRGSRARF